VISAKYRVQQTNNGASLRRTEATRSRRADERPSIQTQADRRAYRQTHTQADYDVDVSLKRADDAHGIPRPASRQQVL